jgi:hypothetical protein
VKIKGISRQSFRFYKQKMIGEQRMKKILNIKYKKSKVIKKR